MSIRNYVCARGAHLFLTQKYDTQDDVNIAKAEWKILSEGDYHHPEISAELPVKTLSKWGWQVTTLGAGQHGFPSVYKPISMIYTDGLITEMNTKDDLDELDSYHTNTHNTWEDDRVREISVGNVNCTELAWNLLWHYYQYKLNEKNGRCVPYVGNSTNCICFIVSLFCSASSKFDPRRYSRHNVGRMMYNVCNKLEPISAAGADLSIRDEFFRPKCPIYEKHGQMWDWLGVNILDLIPEHINL